MACCKALKIVVDRIIAPLKPQTETVEFELLGDTPAEYAKSILLATSEGKLSASVACELLAAAANCLKIVEVSELLERLEILEKRTT